MAIPSIIVAEGLGISSGVVDSFISSLARVDLLVVLLSPSGVAKAWDGPKRMAKDLLDVQISALAC